jgi:hypothetical protein
MEKIIIDNPKAAYYQRVIFTCEDEEDSAIVYSITKMFEDPQFEITLIKNLIKHFDVSTDPSLREDIPELISLLSEKLQAGLESEI